MQQLAATIKHATNDLVAFAGGAIGSTYPLLSIGTYELAHLAINAIVGGVISLAVKALGEWGISSVKKWWNNRNNRSNA